MDRCWWYSPVLSNIEINGKLSICMHFLSWQAGSILWKFHWKKLDICRLRCHDRETDLKVLSRLFEEMFSPTKKQPRNSTRILAKRLWLLGNINVTIIQETNTTRFSSKIVNEDYFVYHLGFRTLKGLVPEDLVNLLERFPVVHFFLSAIFRALSEQGVLRTGEDWWVGLKTHPRDAVDHQTWVVFITLDTKIIKRIQKDTTSGQKTCFHFLGQVW